ncbi:MAG: formyltransferase [Magnetococcales bacterium]|nr:formyltransferase [Magnetococcales bacterium]
MKPTTARAVVFAYHTVGVRGLATLLDHGLAIPLVITHTDDPNETLWFDSVAEWADREGIPVLTPDSPNTTDVLARVAACKPDFIFSFYYRHLLGAGLLAIPTRGAYNLHGSLLPQYRGRVPINWAVLHGERQTGASLHRMVVKADAGDLVDQEPVTILDNDTAHGVFQKVVCAGERVLQRSVPRLLAGNALHTPLDLARGSCFGRRRPEDGRIDWQTPAWTIHNLIRAVAPPYPGAFFDYGSTRIQVLGSHFRRESAKASTPSPRLYWEEGRCYVDCVDGLRLLLTRLAVADQPLDEEGFRALKQVPLAIKVPNIETRAAMAEADAIAHTHQARFGTATELFDDLEKNSGK